MARDAGNHVPRALGRGRYLGLVAAAALAATSCSGVALTQGSAAFPTALHFAALPANQSSPDCDPPQPGSASGSQPTGGPFPTAVVASGHGLQLFAACTRTGVSPAGGGSWVIRRAPVDLTAAAITGPKTIIALGSLPGDASTFQVASTDGGRSWSSFQLTGPSPPSSDTLSCSPSGDECLAIPSLLQTWAYYCPAPMGAPPTPARPDLPVYLYRQGWGWTDLSSLPAGFLAGEGAIAADGTIWLAGSLGRGGMLLSSADGGLQFAAVLSAPTPLNGVSFEGEQGMVVGGPQACLQGREPPTGAEVVYASSDAGTRWEPERDTAGADDLTEVQLAAPGVAYASGSYHGSIDDLTCGDVAYAGCLSPLLVTRDDGRSWEPAWGSAKLPFYGLQAFTAISPEELLVSANGGLVSSRDGGSDWTYLPQLGGSDVTGAQFFSTDPSDGIALAELGPARVTLKTRDGGRSWRLSPAIAPSGAGGTDWVSLTVGYQVAGRGRLLRTTDGGRSWRRLSWPFRDDELEWLYFQNRADGWAAVQGSRQETLATTTDGGRVWRKLGRLGNGLHQQWAAALIRGGSEEQLRLTPHGWVLSGDGLRPETSRRLAHWKDPTAAALQPGGWIWVAGELEGFTATGCGSCGPAIWLGNRAGAARQYRGIPAGVSALGFAGHRFGWLIAGTTLYTSRDGGLDWSPVALSFSGPGFSSAQLGFAT